LCVMKFVWERRFHGLVLAIPGIFTAVRFVQLTGFSIN
jgi:hypothetical protein